MTVTRTPPCRAFRPVLRSEWVKFRTVRGWLVGLIVAAGLCVGFTFLVANGGHEGICTVPNPSSCHTGHPFVPTGPAGEAVADSYYFVDQPLSGNSSITAQVVSLTGLTSTAPLDVAPSLADVRPGLASWAKAGVMVTPSTTQGSAYASVMTTGDHGIRWQYNYTHDRAGPGRVSAGSPPWLRLIRAGDRLTGYDSTNGTTWTEIGSTRLVGLPPTVTVGLFVTSPVSFEASNGAATDATATFDHVSIHGAGASNDWHGQSIGTGSESYYPTLGSGAYHRSDNSFIVSGSGDIAPGVGKELLGADTAGSILLLGLIVGLIVMIVLATMFITTEYRRGLIRTTFTATPNRSRVLAAKAVVIGAIAFVTVAIAAAAAIPLGEHKANGNGDYILPLSVLTNLRVVAGAAAVVAVTAVAVLALGAILRKSAGAVTAGIVVFVLPYILGQLLSGAVQEWLFRLTPAAGFDVLGTLARSGQVAYPYTFGNGYYPLAPWAGFLVLCAYSTVALCVATIVVRRRDA